MASSLRRLRRLCLPPTVDITSRDNKSRLDGVTSSAYEVLLVSTHILPAFLPPGKEVIYPTLPLSGFSTTTSVGLSDWVSKESTASSIPSTRGLMA
jgi:hypothetical protein